MPKYYSTGSPWYSQRYSIKKVIIEKGVTNISEDAFQNCSDLTSVTIPNSVTSIEDEAFSGCESLKSVNIPNSVTSIGWRAFFNCTSLSSISIPNSVTSIKNSAFEYCSGLTSIIVKNGNIYYDSRDNCNAIIETKSNTLISGCKNTVIPNSVTSIGNSAFSGSALTSITIPNSVTSIGNEAFYNCKSLSSITIPNSVTSIGYAAFCFCSFTSIDIPNSVSSIRYDTFKYCFKLKSVTIPKSVTSIENSAFYLCSGLSSITCDAVTPPTYGSNCFYQVNKSIPVYVPANSVAKYKSADKWKEFTNIQPISVDPNLTLALTDANADLTEGYYKKEKVTYTRNNLSIGDYATFCLPFDIDLSNTSDNFSNVYIPLNISLCKPSGALLLLLDEVNSYSTIKAGQPFVAKCKTSNVTFKNSSEVSFEGTISNPSATSVKVYNFDGVSAALTQKNDVDVRIGGTFSKTTGLNDNYYRAFFTNGSFGPTTSVNPFRMYVYKNDYNAVGSKITSISFDFSEVTTGIRELQMTNEKSSVFDLNGRAVNGKNLKSGIYIINGKKYIK